MNLETFLNNLPASIPARKALLFQAPGRINIIGEHTDYNQGFCLPAALNKYLYFAIVPSYETKIYSINQQNEWTPNSNSHPADWSVYFKGVLDLLREKGYQWPYFNLAFGGNLPMGAGLSSSSAICCGFIAILNEFAGLNLSKEKQTTLAVQAEKADGLTGGMMDQITIINAKKNHALFIQCQDGSFDYIPIPQTDISWIVVDTKIKHKLVETEYNTRSKSCNEIYIIAKSLFKEIQSISQLNVSQQSLLVKHLSSHQKNLLTYIMEENERVKNMLPFFAQNNVIQIGQKLFDGHEGLRKLYQVSCAELDFLVDYAYHSGICYGARMMGGGFGGSTLHLVKTSEKLNYIKGITNAYSNRFGFEPDVFEVGFDDGVKKI